MYRISLNQILRSKSQENHCYENWFIHLLLIKKKFLKDKKEMCILFSIIENSILTISLNSHRKLKKN